MVRGATVPPAPARTSVTAIVTAGRRIVEDEGLDSLTMQKVAAAVGVKAPSLYKRVRDRAGLVQLIADVLALELAAELDGAVGSGDARVDLRAITRSFRDFTRANPTTYRLLFDPRLGGTSADARDRASASVLKVVHDLAGRDALPAARMVVAWASGFVSMELAGAFQLGGDVDEAWEYGVAHLIDALERR
jgi:AcrR family transcriptional regulator